MRECVSERLDIINFVYISTKRLNRTASAWIGTLLVKPTDFHFFLPKSENAVFKYRLFAHLNILVLASWPSGIWSCLDTRGWQFDSWRGVLLRATFCSGALLRQPSHHVVSDPFSCQIQIRDSEMKKAKRLLLLQRVLDRVYIFEWLLRLHDRQVKPPTSNCWCRRFGCISPAPRATIGWPITTIPPTCSEADPCDTRTLPFQKI